MDTNLWRLLTWWRAVFARARLVSCCLPLYPIVLVFELDQVWYPACCMSGWCSTDLRGQSRWERVFYLVNISLDCCSPHDAFSNLGCVVRNIHVLPKHEIFRFRFRSLHLDKICIFHLWDFWNFKSILDYGTLAFSPNKSISNEDRKYLMSLLMCVAFFLCTCCNVTVVMIANFAHFHTADLDVDCCRNWHDNQNLHVYVFVMADAD